MQTVGARGAAGNGTVPLNGSDDQDLLAQARTESIPTYSLASGQATSNQLLLASVGCAKVSGPKDVAHRLGRPSGRGSALESFSGLLGELVIGLSFLFCRRGVGTYSDESRLPRRIHAGTRSRAWNVVWSAGIARSGVELDAQTVGARLA